MKEVFETVWDEYFFEKCAKMDTDEERRLAKKTIEFHEAASSLLNEEQENAVEKYVDALCDMEAIFVKKAFLKGCEFSFSFLWRVGNLKQ